MTLMAIKNHMMQVRMSSLAALCAVFQSDPDTVRCMLSHFIRKGYVRQCLKKPACGTKCFKCPMAAAEMYEWVVN